MIDTGVCTHISIDSMFPLLKFPIPTLPFGVFMFVHSYVSVYTISAYIQ